MTNTIQKPAFGLALSVSPKQDIEAKVEVMAKRYQFDSALDFCRAFHSEFPERMDGLMEKIRAARETWKNFVLEGLKETKSLNERMLRHLSFFPSEIDRVVKKFSQGDWKQSDLEEEILNLALNGNSRALDVLTTFGSGNLSQVTPTAREALDDRDERQAMWAAVKELGNTVRDLQGFGLFKDPEHFTRTALTVGAFATGSVAARGAIWFMEGAGVGMETLLAKEAVSSVVNGAVVPLLTPRDGELTPEGYFHEAVNLAGFSMVMAGRGVMMKPFVEDVSLYAGETAGMFLDQGTNLGTLTVYQHSVGDEGWIASAAQAVHTDLMGRAGGMAGEATVQGMQNFDWKGFGRGFKGGLIYGPLGLVMGAPGGRTYFIGGKPYDEILPPPPAFNNGRADAVILNPTTIRVRPQQILFSRGGEVLVRFKNEWTVRPLQDETIDLLIPMREALDKGIVRRVGSQIVASSEYFEIEASKLETPLDPTYLERGVLARRMLNPAAPQGEAVREIAEQYSDPRQAWESLYTNGLIPESWIDEPSRVFGEILGGRSVLASQPLSTRAAIALASDPAGVTTAENLAREAYRRIGKPVPDKILWLVAEDPTKMTLPFAVVEPRFIAKPAAVPVFYSVEATQGAARRYMTGSKRQFGEPFEAVMHRIWAESPGRAQMIDKLNLTHSIRVNDRFASNPEFLEARGWAENPMEPVVEILKLGYVMMEPNGRPVDPKNNVIILVAPSPRR